MQKHNWQFSIMLVVIMLIMIGSYAAVYAEDPAFAKTVFYVR